MKRTLSLILAAIMLMSLVACGGNNDTGNTGNTGSTGSSDSTGSTGSSAGTMDAGQATGVQGSTDAEAEYAKELTLCMSLADLDPGVAWNATREGYQRLVFDTLLYHDDTTGEITMQLAESVEWANEECSKIHVILRDDIVFSNGEKMTAEDVEYSIARNTYSSVTSFYDSCEIISDTELYINLKTPCSAFMPVLSRAATAVVCKSAAEAHPDKLALIGTGPYTYDMDTYVAANSITLRRNEKFWGEQNPTEVINIVKIGDNSAAAAALKTGEVNLVFSVGETDLPALEADENIGVTKYNSYNFVYMSFNDQTDSTTLTEEDKNFRRAIACAINKEDIVAGLGGGMVMTSMWPYDHDAYLANESDYEHDLSYNPEKAKEYLANAGGRTEFTCLVDTGRSWCKLAAQVMQEYLKQIGITMNIEETDSTGFSSMTKWGTLEYDASLWSNLFVMETVNWNYYTNGSSVNRAMMNDPEITAALDAVKATSDKEELVGLYQTMQREVHDNVSWLPLVFRQMNYCYTAGLENFELTASPTYILRNIRLRTN